MSSTEDSNKDASSKKIASSPVVESPKFYSSRAEAEESIASYVRSYLFKFFGYGVVALVLIIVGYIFNEFNNLYKHIGKMDGLIQSALFNNYGEQSNEIIRLKGEISILKSEKDKLTNCINNDKIENKKDCLNGN